MGSRAAQLSQQWGSRANRSRLYSSVLEAVCARRPSAGELAAGPRAEGTDLHREAGHPWDARVMQPGTPRPGREGREALGRSWGLVPWVCTAATKARALDPAALGHCTSLGLGAGVLLVVVRMALWSPLFPQALATGTGHPRGDTQGGAREPSRAHSGGREASLGWLRVERPRVQAPAMQWAAVRPPFPGKSLALCLSFSTCKMDRASGPCPHSGLAEGSIHVGVQQRLVGLVLRAPEA